MFLARIDGVLTSTHKHEAFTACRFLIGQRLEADGSASGEPLVILDRDMGARTGTTVLVSTDGDIARQWLGNNTPARLIVAGIVDHVYNGVRS